MLFILLKYHKVEWSSQGMVWSQRWRAGTRQPGHGGWLPQFSRLLPAAAVSPLLMVFGVHRSSATTPPPPSPLLRKLIHASEDSEDLAPLLMALEEFTGLICSPVYSWSHLERGLALTAPRTSYTKNMNSRYVYLLSDSCQVCRGTPLLWSLRWA